VAYILREAFDYAYQEIADILQTSEANTRQLVTVPRAHIENGRRTRVSSAEPRRVLHTFIAAVRTGDLDWKAFSASDIVSYSDGGGVVRAAQKPVLGRDRVAKFIAAVSSHFWNGVTLSWIEANGQPSKLAAISSSRQRSPDAYPPIRSVAY
jgi:hypothetical protein